MSAAPRPPPRIRADNPPRHGTTCDSGREHASACRSGAPVPRRVSKRTREKSTQNRSKLTRLPKTRKKNGDEPLRYPSLHMSKNERSTPRAITAEHQARHGYQTHPEFPPSPRAPPGGGDVYRPKAKNSLRTTFPKLLRDDEQILGAEPLEPLKP